MVQWKVCGVPKAFSELTVKLRFVLNFSDLPLARRLGNAEAEWTKHVLEASIELQYVRLLFQDGFRVIFSVTSVKSCEVSPWCYRLQPPYSTGSALRVSSFMTIYDIRMYDAVIYADAFVFWVYCKLGHFQWDYRIALIEEVMPAAVGRCATGLIFLLILKLFSLKNCYRIDALINLFVWYFKEFSSLVSLWNTSTNQAWLITTFRNLWIWSGETDFPLENYMYK